MMANPARAYLTRRHRRKERGRETAGQEVPYEEEAAAAVVDKGFETTVVSYPDSLSSSSAACTIPKAVNKASSLMPKD
jgi:hypothetical protein